MHLLGANFLIAKKQMNLKSSSHFSPQRSMIGEEDYQRPSTTLKAF